MIWYPQDDALTSLNLLKMASTKNGIPAGWAVCDGSNGTPDLRGRFVLMAQDDIPAGAPSGSTVHPIMSKGGEETYNFEINGYNVMFQGGDSFSTQTHSSNKMPPYYTLVYIMKL